MCQMVDFKRAIINIDLVVNAATYYRVTYLCL